MRGSLSSNSAARFRKAWIGFKSGCDVIILIIPPSQPKRKEEKKVKEGERKIIIIINKKECSRTSFLFHFSFFLSIQQLSSSSKKFNMGGQ